MSIKFPNLKRFFSLFLAAVMMVSLLAVNAHAANANKITDYGDAYGHWAYEALTWAVDNGVLVGTSEDKLNPDGYLTRAQMAAMIGRLFGTYKSADISRFTDVPRGSWHHNYIAQAVHMGTFAGYSNSRMGPDENITREQAMVVLARTVCLPSASNSALARFPDRNQVGAWAADSVAAMVERGYVSGYRDGRLNPKGQITRAEMAQIMSNIFQSVHDSGEITGTHRDTVLVRGVVNIQDAVFESDLILANGLGEKALDLTNVTVKGRLVVWGGSAVNITGKSTVAGVVTPRNDGPVQVVFDVAAAELSEKDCSIVYPSGMDKGNKVLFADKVVKPAITFNLPAYLYVGDSAMVKTTLTGTDTVAWELTRDGKLAAMPEGFTKDGGTLALSEAGRYTLTATLTDAAGKKYTTSQTVTVLPVMIPTVTTSAKCIYEGDTAEIRLSVEHGTPSTVRWALTRDGENIPVSLGDNGGKLTFDKAGAYVLTATVTDKLGKEYAAALPLEVRPVIVLTLDAPETAHTGQPAAVRLSETNLDVTWKVVSEDGAAVENDFTNGGGEITFDTAGTYTVTASVTDSLGRTFTASGTITVWDTMGLSFKLPEFSHPDETVKVKVISENVGDRKLEWSLTVDGQPVSLSAGIKGSLDNEGGSVKFMETGTNVLTASVTDGLGRTFTYEQTIEVYPVLHMELTADAAVHTDEPVSVSLSKDTDLPVAWSVTPSNDPSTAATYSGELSDNGGTIQITSAGAYDISASVTDATGRVFAAPAVTVMVYPVAGLDFTLPAAAWTDSSTPVDLLTSDLQGRDVTWTLTKDGAAVSLTGSMLGDLGNLGGKVRFPEAGIYTLAASATDALGRVTAATASIQIYPVGMSGFYLPHMFHTDSTVTLVTGFEELGENPLRWSLTRNGENVPVADYVTGELTEDGGKVQFKQAGEYKLRASFQDTGGRSYSYEQSFTVYPIPVIAWTMPSYGHTDSTFTVAVESRNVVADAAIKWHIDDTYGLRQNWETYVAGNLTIEPGESPIDTLSLAMLVKLSGSDWRESLYPGWEAHSKGGPAF